MPMSEQLDTTTGEHDVSNNDISSCVAVDVDVDLEVRFRTVL